MFLVILTALAAVCGAAKLDTSYLPPISARTAGGSPGALLAPLDGTNQVAGGLPTGSYTNDAQGVIVDAANPGSRASGAEPTGLGGPRASYGSTDSKVGEAAFTGFVTGLGSSGVNTRIAPGFGSFVDTDSSQDDKKSGSKLKFTTDVGLENYSYGFETDNGISVGENGVASGGVQAQGGYSYKGDDGKTYSVTYTADKDGYKPQGQHLPTPHPIPEEILKSLEKNAKEEAAGHVDDGSYDAQKYNDEGDYSSNGAGNNNGRPIVGGGAATSSGAYASQSSQGTRPTSGVLIGSYKPQATLNQFSQGGVVGQDSGKKEHSEVSGHGSSFKGQFGQSGSSKPQASHTSSHFTENRFGFEGYQGGHQFLGTGAGSPVRTSNFDNSPNSAFSSAVATGSGSASAFASSGSVGSGLKNEFNAPSNYFGSAGQQAHSLESGSYSSPGASLPAPSTATASASVSGSQTQQYSGSQNAYPSSEPQLSGNFLSVHEHGQSPSSASASATVSGSQHQQLHGINSELNSNTVPNRFGEGQLSGNSASVGKYESTGKPQGFDSSSAASTANSQPLSSQASASVSGSSTFGASTQESGFESQKTQLSNANTQFTGIKPSFGTNQGSNQVSSFNSFGSNNVPSSSAGASLSSQIGSADATFASSTQKPTVSQQQGVDDSYYYKQPSKPFAIPIPNNRQPNYPASSSLQGSKYSNTQTLSTTGQYQGISSSSNNGITQAAISPFESGTASLSTQSASSSSQFDSKPAQSTQFGQLSSSQQTTTQFGTSGSQTSQKPIVQSQTQFSQSTTSQAADSSQTPTQQYQGTVYQYNKPEVTLSTQGNKDSSSTSGQVKPGQFSTGNRFGSQQSSSQFGTQSSFQQTQTNVGSNVGTSQISQKPIVSSQTIGSNYQQTQFGAGSQYNQKPQTVQSSFTSTINKQNQQFTKPQSVAFGNTFAQNQNQFGTKPSATTQTGSSFQQSQFGLASSQFGQKPQTQGSSFTSTQYQQTQFTKPQTTVGSSVSGSTFSQGQAQFGKKPSSTAQTGSSFQQAQFGSAATQFNQKPQLTQGSGLPSTFGQKPVGSTQTGSSFQQSQFGLSSSQFGQKPQTQAPAGSSVTGTFSQSQAQFGKKPSETAFGQKPVGNTQTESSFQQSQFGSTSSQFVQKPQSQGSSFSSTTNTQNQQSQFTKPQATVGSSATANAFSQSQTQYGKKPSESTFGQKPVGTSQTGSSFQQSQFGSTVSQVKPQIPQGSGSVSTSGQTVFAQKPVSSTQSGSYYQQSQFGASSQFGQKPQTQGSSFTSNKYSQGSSFQFEKKPVISTQTSSTSQQTQFGQNSQTIQGSGFGSTTIKPSFGQKPFGSSFQQNQLGSTVSQYGQNSQTSFGKKPISQQSQFGLGSSQLTQAQSNQFGSKPISTTQTGSAFGSQIQPGSASSQFGQKPLNTQFGSTSSQFSQNSQTSQSSVSTASQASFGSKPVNLQNKFGSVGSQFSQTSQYGKKPTETFPSNQGFGVSSTTAKPSIEKFDSSYQQTQQTQFGQKPLTSQFGSTSHFGQNSQSSQGSSLTSTNTQTSFNSKPVNQQTQFGSTGSQFSQTTQFGKKPTGASSTTSQTGSVSQQSSFQYGQKPQTNQGSGFNSNSFSQGQTTQFVSKPAQIGSTFQQSLLGGSQFNQPQIGTGSPSTFGQSSFAQKPSSTVQTSSFTQQSQTSSTESKGQAQSDLAGFNQNTGSGSQNTQYSNAQYEQKPQLNAGVVSQSQSSDKISGSSSSSESGFQSQFSSSSESQFGQANQESSQAQAIQTTQSGIKPVGSSQSSQSSAQFGSTPSRFGETSQSSQVNIPTLTTISQSVKPTGSFGYKPYVPVKNSGFGFQTVSSTPAPVRFGSTAAHFGQQPQAQASAFASSSGSNNLASFGNTQTGQVYQQTSQFGVQNQAVSTTQKPIVSSLSQSNYQQEQYTQTSDKLNNQPQFGQGTQTNLDIGQFSGQSTFGAVSQKPVGSQLTQSSFQQTAFNQPQKLASSQGTFQVGQSVGTQSTQSNLQSSSVTASQGSQSSFGGVQSGNSYNYQQPQSVFTTQFGSQGSQDQKVQQTQSNFNSVVSTTQNPINSKPLNSFGVSSTQGSFQQTQSSTQFGAQSTKPVGSGPIIQTTFNKLNGQSFKPVNTASTQGSGFQSQSSAVSTSRFGDTQPAGLAHFSGQSFQSASSHSSGVGSQSVIGSTPEYTIQPAQGYEILTNQGFVGQLEAFGGPRDPPKFDEKTGYHY